MRRILFTRATIAALIAALAPALALAGDREDQATADQIATLLRDSGKMRNYSVGVKYKDGTVWLSGRVASKEQLQTALSVVSEIEGIEQIVNNMTVSKGTAAMKQSARSMQQPAAARRVSATSADLDIEAPTAASRPHVKHVAPAAERGATPAGYHRLAAKHAAKHAGPVPAYMPPTGGMNPPAFDQPHMPNYAWPSYAAYPNYSALTYPQQYSPTAWPFIGPFYPYPQVPLGWRKVALEWDDGWWFLDFYDRGHH